MRLPDLFKRLGLFKLISTYIDSKLGYNEGGGEEKKIVHPIIIIFTRLSIIEQSLFKMETIRRLENYT